MKRYTLEYSVKVRIEVNANDCEEAFKKADKTAHDDLKYEIDHGKVVGRIEDIN